MTVNKEIRENLSEEVGYYLSDGWVRGKNTYIERIKYFICDYLFSGIVIGVHTPLL